MERLGLGPNELLAINPALIYGRITGYGQDGPLASEAGHDINYLAMSGALSATARAGERPLFRSTCWVITAGVASCLLWDSCPEF